MTEQLLACPFCGGTNLELQTSPDDNLDLTFYFWRCKKVGCGTDGPSALRLSDAAEKWNTRPIEDDLRQHVESLLVARARLKDHIIELERIMAGFVEGLMEGELKNGA